MTPPVYLNTPSSSSSSLELKKDDHHQHFQLIFSTTTTPSSSYQASSSHPCSSFFYTNPQSHKGGDHHNSPRHPQHHHDDDDDDKDDKYIFSHGGYGEISKSSHDQLSVSKKEERDHEGNKSGSAKWMSSKMRMMRKMTNSECTTAKIAQKDEPHHNIYDINTSNNISNVPIRVCSDCNTTKTPLWRSGPRGPKSLCNACGIRQRKARRAMAAAAAEAANGASTVGAEASAMKLHSKEKKMHTSNAGQHKKLCKPACPPLTKKKLCYEEFTSSLSKNNSGFRRVFPQDEEEAAILLMALSCDLVYR